MGTEGEETTIKRLSLPALLILISSLGHSFEVKEVEVGPAKRILKWDTLKGPIRITLNPTGSADLPITVVETALRNAMNQWQNVSGQSVRFVYAGRSSAAVSNSSDGINSVLWIEKNWPNSASTAAITRFSFFVSDPPLLADADILLNGQHFRWSITPGGGTVHPQQILTHELGHLLGLSHSSNFRASMFPDIAPIPRLAIFPDDMEGLRFLYGSPATDFRLITPLAGATYQLGTEQQLPLPVFRWGRGSFGNFTIEFSDTPSFQKKVSFSAGSNNFFVLTAAQQKQILQLSPARNIQWRVSSGSTRTASRVLRFRASLAPAAPLTYAELPGEAEIPWEQVAWMAAVAVSLGAAAIFFLRRRRRASY